MAQQEYTSHPFGDLIRQHLNRKHGLTQKKLAEGIDVDPSTITRMCQGEKLSGAQSRERIVAIIDWLHQQRVLATLSEANALLEAADLAGLKVDKPKEAALIATLDAEAGVTAGSASRMQRPALWKIRRSVGLVLALLLGIISAGIYGWNFWSQSPTTQLERQLAAANILLSGGDATNTARVRKWLQEDAAYQTLAERCLDVLAGRRVRANVHLDTINGKYKQRLGTAPDDYLPPTKYHNDDMLKAAILEHWNEIYPNSYADSFDQIVELSTR